MTKVWSTNRDISWFIGSCSSISQENAGPVWYLMTLPLVHSLGEKELNLRTEPGPFDRKTADQAAE
jgi:hypothetical protein